MAFQPVLDTALVELVYTTQGGTAENTLYMQRDDSWTPLTLEALAAFMFDWWVDNVQALQSNQIALQAIRVRDLEVEEGAYFELTEDMPINGTLASPVLPSNTTGAITFQTGYAGKSNRGRNFVIGIPEGEVVGDAIDLDYVDEWQNAYNALLTATISLGEYQWVVVSRYHDGVLRSPTATTRPVTGVSMDATVDSQRRRLAGRGS